MVYIHDVCLHIRSHIQEFLYIHVCSALLYRDALLHWMFHDITCALWDNHYILCEWVSASVCVLLLTQMWSSVVMAVPFCCQQTIIQPLPYGNDHTPVHSRQFKQPIQIRNVCIRWNTFPFSIVFFKDRVNKRGHVFYCIRSIQVALFLYSKNKKENVQRTKYFHPTKGFYCSVAYITLTSFSLKFFSTSSSDSHEKQSCFQYLKASNTSLWWACILSITIK